MLVWHRRGGKDLTALNYAIKAMFHRVGAYYYFFPEFAQARRVIWDGRDKEGRRFMDHFPKPLVKSTHANEMKVTTVNGSILQLIGTDNYDSIVGSNPVGCVFSEFALQDPMAWQLVRPILRENGGWAIFVTTPRGRNHAWELAETAQKRVMEGDKDWFYQRLTVNDTGVFSAADIEAERREGMDEDLIQQEYYCSFSGSQQGNYYGKQMDHAEADGRICKVPHQPEHGVHTWWDLGMSDAMAITFTQDVGREIHVIDYLEDSGKGLSEYAKQLQAKPYVYAGHHGPHDIAVRELGTGKSRLETAASFGIRFDIVPNIGLQDGIDATRAFLGRCVFDRDKTERLRHALVSYHKTWDEKRKMFSDTPSHDWSSHPADSFRMLAVGHKASGVPRAQRVGRVLTSESPNAWMG